MRSKHDGADEQSIVRVVIVQHLEGTAVRTARDDLLAIRAPGHRTCEALEAVATYPAAVTPEHQPEQQRNADRGNREHPDHRRASLFADESGTEKSGDVRRDDEHRQRAMRAGYERPV